MGIFDNFRSIFSSKKETIELNLDDIPNSYECTKTGIEFILVKPGTFLMGNNEGISHDSPVHKVTITKPFFMGKFSVTQKQYQKVIETNPSINKAEENPVENVSWDDCMDFVKKLNKFSEEDFRLPTEAEWEYCCKAGTTSLYFFGDNKGDLCDYGWYKDNSGRKSQKVGTKKQNPWGFYDMLGNVWEWCQDWHSPYTSKAVTDPKGASSGNNKISRGGACNGSEIVCSCSTRNGTPPDNKSYAYGFRLVKPISS